MIPKILILYALFGMWAFYFKVYLCKHNFRTEIAYLNKNLKDKNKTYPYENYPKNISYVHSLSLIGRSIITHYWTILSISSMLLSNYLVEYIPHICLLLLCHFPSHIDHDIAAFGFINIETDICNSLHCMLSILYVILNVIVLFSYKSKLSYISFFCMILCGIFIFNGHKYASLIEITTATIFSLFYLNK